MVNQAEVTGLVRALRDQGHQALLCVWRQGHQPYVACALPADADRDEAVPQLALKAIKLLMERYRLTFADLN